MHRHRDIVPRCVHRSGSQAAALLVAQGFHRILQGSSGRRHESCQRTDQEGTDTDQYHVASHDLCRNLTELINPGWKDFDPERPRQPFFEFVSEVHRQQTHTQPDRDANGPDDDPLDQEDEDNLGRARTQRFKYADLSRLLNGHRDQGAHDSKTGHDDDEEHDEDGHRIWTNVESLHEVARVQESMLGEAESAKLAWKASTEVEFRVTSWLSLLATVNTIGRQTVRAEYRKDY